MTDLYRRAEAWVADHGEHDPSDKIGDVGGLYALAAFAESVTDDLRADAQVEVARLRAALETVRDGCPAAEASAAALYGPAWRNRVIDEALAGPRRERTLDADGHLTFWLDGDVEWDAYKDGDSAASARTKEPT